MAVSVLVSVHLRQCCWVAAPLLPVTVSFSDTTTGVVPRYKEHWMTLFHLVCLCIRMHIYIEHMDIFLWIRCFKYLSFLTFKPGLMLPASYAIL